MCAFDTVCSIDFLNAHSSVVARECIRDRTHLYAADYNSEIYFKKSITTNDELLFYMCIYVAINIIDVDMSIYWLRFFFFCSITNEG